MDEPQGSASLSPASHPLDVEPVPPPDVESAPPPGAAVYERETEKEEECVHKTKTIQFLGRTTPVVLQNDNGPCPLLAICNVLLLRNNLNLSPDLNEVSQETLLSLVAERLIDSNSNVKDKDAGYIENQQQNVADAIDLLPRLATGIDVNIKFKRIDDFEFTPECAIFDLLDIPLYHGWIVDPQDHETACAIGSKSYNAIMGELVALETQCMDGRPKTDMDKNNAEEDSIDFAAATTATLGVPSPSLSRTRSFDDSPRSVCSLDRAKKGDLEEEADLMMALKLSEGELSGLVAGSVVNHGDEGVPPVATDQSTSTRRSVPLDHVDSEGYDVTDRNHCVADDVRNVTVTSPEDIRFSSLEIGLSNHLDQSSIVNLGESFSFSVVTNNIVEMPQTADVVPPSAETIYSSMEGEAMVILKGVEEVETESTPIADIHKQSDIFNGHNSLEVSGLSVLDQASEFSGRIQNIDAPETLNSSADGSEPIYEGEECILGSATTVHGDEEPKYEGEVILAKQVDTVGGPIVEITSQQGELIKSFLKNNANQLTFHGLFCLQEGLKERELCVFFRNNHFSTMFKYEGELYLLATDQGYINQPDLVWEKLNEVNGDTLFMTSNFAEFKLENNENETWDEQNAMTSTADYIASMDSAVHAGLDMNSDLRLAIALQQQEFEQQQSQRHNPQQQTIGGSGLITGPQRPSNSRRVPSSSSGPEPKPKDKCIVM